MSNSNKFSRTALIMFRVKLLSEQNADSFLSPEQIETIKHNYPFTQWSYRIALRELQLGLIDSNYEIRYL